MKVLVACEESQAVTIEFRKRGHEAYSCDIQDCSGGHPEWHIKGDAIKEAYSGKYDMMIAHPPCTYLSNSGVSWLYKDPFRWGHMDDGAAFFKMLLDSPIKKIAVENPVPHKYAVEKIGRKYDQSIQPYQFGHAESKRTCFWLKGLKPLKETDNVKKEWKSKPKNEAQRIHYLPPGPERAKLRSKTFPGIAKAMAEQWE
ncbi:MAG: hypothetical protein GY793_05610 [Proteobacteria bacterium]|nr:hypothetical protein [Pseudomonadota bacterium]